jgi:hypothetical protein
MIDVIGLRCFCYHGIGAITIYAYTRMFFSKYPGKSKYNTTSNCISLLKIIEYIDTLKDGIRLIYLDEVTCNVLCYT